MFTHAARDTVIPAELIPRTLPCHSLPEGCAAFTGMFLHGDVVHPLAGLLFEGVR
jgi:hypothetical protein